MKNIDFLPDIYRQQRILRRARVGWAVVAVLFSAVIAAAASGQWAFRTALAVQVAKVEPQYAISLAREAEIAQLEADRIRAEELAALYQYLEHPWPRTQLLAAVARSLPATMQLTELTLLEQAAGVPLVKDGESDTIHSTAESEKGEKPTAKSVLAGLRRDLDRQSTIIELHGDATSVKDLHEYVESLGRSPLFSSASLKGLSSSTDPAGTGAAMFQIRIVVRPGFGQPQVPTPQANTAAVAVAGGSRNTPGNPGGSP